MTNVEGTEKAPKKAKEPKVKKIAKHDPSERIVFGQDKEGKDYGKTNNPKRGQAAEYFAMYKSNMTLAKAVEAGIPTANIAWDLSKGFIRIVE